MKNEKYHISIRVLHWLMALIILGLIACGLYMEDLEKDAPYRETLYWLHKSFGALIIILVALRILFRISTKIPELPFSIPLFVQKLAHFGHFLLYILMIAVPVSGYAMSNSFGYPVVLFNITLPMLFPKDKEFGELAGEAHEFLAYALFAVILLHVAGVIKHRFFDKKENDVLRRML